MSNRHRFWKPGFETGDQSTDRPEEGETERTNFVYNPHSSLSIQKQRQRLPIFKNRNHILHLLENYQTLIIVGETGCGKSTQIPQITASFTKIIWDQKTFFPRPDDFTCE
ncbi:probable ATP-dependent RNA helicase DHX35 [Centruroides sculpturatus]|uniref:probable ATP-dependent RNA helicase DHX35 n=1 Tax=Centruroides sculpturatus TaxID=218467 RepID=UPI000C6CDA17|nr:probable ATP-dependent RNA helicase DHX35 [Centruroides sculpturatus]